MTEAYKYVSWIVNGVWQPHRLVRKSEAVSLIKRLGWRYEVFATIQDLDSSGNVVSSPLYFEFDGEFDDVRKRTQDLVWAINTNLNLVPNIYFSGNKGFHITVPYIIEHPRCYLIIKKLAETALVDGLDYSVYTPRRLWRLPNSKASQPGYHKVQITRDELYRADKEYILKISKQSRRIVSECDISKIDHEVIDEWIEDAKKAMPREKKIAEFEGEKWDVIIPPCIHELLDNPCPRGNRHNTAYVIATFFKQNGYSKEEIHRLFMDQIHWAMFNSEKGEINTLLESLWKRDRDRVGCKSDTPHADIMREHCDSLCPFHPSFNLSVVGNGISST